MANDHSPKPTDETRIPANVNEDKRENYRRSILSAARRKLADNREDRLNQILVDTLADAVLAAHYDGYSRDEIAQAIWSGARHGWADACEQRGLDEIENDTEGARFASSLQQIENDATEVR